MKQQWRGFKGTKWTDEVNVRDFIQNNYTAYDGNEDFLTGPTAATDKLWTILKGLQKEERAKGGVLDMETEVVSGLTAYGPGYIGEGTKELERGVGLQTDKPLKEASKWPNRRAQHMVMNLRKSCTRSSASIIRPIMTVSLTLTRTK